MPRWRATVRSSVLGRPLLLRAESETLDEVAARMGDRLEREEPSPDEIERGERDYRRFRDASAMVEGAPRTIGRSTQRIGDAR